MLAPPKIADDGRLPPSLQQQWCRHYSSHCRCLCCKCTWLQDRETTHADVQKSQKCYLFMQLMQKSLVFGND